MIANCLIPFDVFNIDRNRMDLNHRMAHIDVKETLTSALLDPPALRNQKSVTRRRLRRSRSAPKDLTITEKNVGITPRIESMFENIHPSFRQVIFFLAVYLTVGAICFSLVNDQIGGKKTNGILDAVYFCIVTMTTVGYGDLVPNSTTTKLLACAFVFTGMAMVGMILSKSADYLVEKQEKLIVKYLHLNKKIGTTDIRKEMETNHAKYKFLVNLAVLLILITIGTVFLIKVEHLIFIDAFYCVCSTITTLGYGDKSFSTQGGRLFAVFWILTSTICLALFFLYLAELFTERKQQAMVKWVLTRRITNVDLEVADLDDDGTVSAAEYVLYQLKEMGKINHEHITLVMKDFEDLDVDDSGTLSASDIVLGQTSRSDS